MTKTADVPARRAPSVLDVPILNKGRRSPRGAERARIAGFSRARRDAGRAGDARLRGLQAQGHDLERHIYLRALQDTNEVLFLPAALDTSRR